MSIKKAIQHLSLDSKLAPVVAHVGLVAIAKNDDLYFTLLRAIVGQQLSTKAAATIWGRFLNLFPHHEPYANLVLAVDTEQLRSVGLSYQKAGYIKNIALFSIEQTLDYSVLKTQTNEELVAYLTQIKGVGKWTVEMILMFSLGREDVFTTDDLGIVTAMKNLYGIDTTNKAYKKEMIAIAEHWKPYRTYACMCLWKWKDELKTQLK
ncbi:MAG: DNA-3-methyladenine glycosylase [Bacteroidia bacterium]